MLRISSSSRADKDRNVSHTLPSYRVHGQARNQTIVSWPTLDPRSVRKPPCSSAKMISRHKREKAAQNNDHKHCPESYRDRAAECNALTVAAFQHFDGRATV